MAKNWTGQQIGSFGEASGLFQFGGDFDKGTTPTLLDASQAKIVKAFIENFLFFSKAHLEYGNVDPKANLIMGDGSLILRISVPTSLLLDQDPHLGADLKLDGKSIIANAGGSIFKAYSDEGLIVGGDSVGKIVLNPAGNEAAGAGSGFKNGGGSVIWQLPPNDSSGDDIILTSISKELDWGGLIGGTDIDVTRDGRNFTIDFTGTTGSSLTVEEIDGSPSVSDVTEIKVSNGQLTSNGGGSVTICTAQEIYLTATGTGQASGGPVGPHPGYEHYDFVAGDGMELKQATTHADGVEFIVQETTLTGDSGSDDWTPGEGINFVGGLGIVTEVTLASQPSVVTTKVDDDVCMSINGIGVGDVSANDFSISAGDNITISTDTSGITIEADKYAIVESPKPDTYVSLACTEMPETRFDDIVKLDVVEQSFSYDLDETYVFVCEEDSIEPISYVCDLPAIAGLKVQSGTLFVNFSELTELPNSITIKLSGIRKGRADKRFVEWTREQAMENAHFWNGWKV